MIINDRWSRKPSISEGRKQQRNRQSNTAYDWRASLGSGEHDVASLLGFAKADTSPGGVF